MNKPGSRLRVCPRCSALWASEDASCRGCGVEFHELTGDPAGGTAGSLPIGSGRVLFSREAVQALICGFVGAVIALAVPLVSYVMSILAILIHEIGHAAAGWAFAYPSLPSFDLIYGGGVAFHFDRIVLLGVLIAAGWGWLLGWLWRAGDVRWFRVGLVMALVYALLFFSAGHQVFILFMGHGTELIFAGIFLYRALAGVAIKVAVERPLYAFAGFFLQLNALGFAWALLTDSAARARYLVGRPGVDPDFLRIARDHLGVELTTVVFLFLLCALTPPFAAWWLARRRAATRD